MADLTIDNFTDTNGTLLTAHTPDTDGIGWGWGELRGTWDIQSNAARSTSTSENWDLAVINAGRADATIEATFTTPASGESAVLVVVRGQSLDNHWRVRNQTNVDSLVITEVNGGGSGTDRDSGAAAMAPNTQYTIKVITSGNTITAYWDDVEIASYASASFLNDIPIFGIGTYTASTTYTTVTFDSFSVTGTAMPTTYGEWTVASGAVGEHPIIKDGTMYVAQFDTADASDDGLEIYHPQSGVLLQRVTVVKNITSAVAIDANNKVHMWSIGPSVPSMFKVDRYKGVETTFTTNLTEIDWEALVYDSANDRILVAANNDLRAVAASNYATAWTNTSTVLTSLAKLTPPLIRGSFIYFFDSNAVLFKLNIADGTTAGSLDLSTETIDSYSQLIYDSVRDDIYITDYRGRTVYSVDVSTSTLAENWSVTLGSAGEEILRGMAYKGDVLYVAVAQQDGSPDGGRRTKIYALDVTNSGATLWTNTTAYDNDAHVSNLLADGDYVYGATFDYLDGSYEKFLVINAANGDLVTTFDLDDGTASAVPAVANGVFFIGLWNNNGLQALRVRDAGGTGDFPWKADSDYTGDVSSFTSGGVTGVETFQPRSGVAIANGVMMV